MFTVVAMDNGYPESNNATVMVTIEVFTPDNHFNPVLNQTTYEASVDENDQDSTPGEQVVLYFSATDEDRTGSPANRLREAELIGVDAIYFTVELTGSNSGVVKTK